MREVILRVRHHGEPESDVSAVHPKIVLRSISSLTGSTAERKRIVEITGPTDEIAAFLDEFERGEPIIDVEQLSSLDNDQAFVGVTYDSYRWDSIAQRLSDLGVHYRVGTIIKAGWEHWTLYLDTEDQLSDIVTSIEEAGNDTELVRNVSLEELESRGHLVFSRMLDELTNRQREVLATAINLGYYGVDADADITDIAQETGIARTTAWEHLARAERSVMQEVGEHLFVQDV